MLSKRPKSHCPGVQPQVVTPIMARYRTYSLEFKRQVIAYRVR